jgi:hypothetical protein
MKGLGQERKNTAKQTFGLMGHEHSHDQEKDDQARKPTSNTIKHLPNY